MAPSLYIHIPFCRRKCLYCDFYSIAYESGIAAAYIDAIVSQVASLEGRLDTVYIGGGTPTVLDSALLERLLRSLEKNIASGTEFTVEANPESLDADKAALLQDMGVNRLSIGLQSLDDRKLKKLGRIHNAVKGAEAVKLASKKSFSDISADIIFGLWGESLGGWKKELEDVSGLPLTHISAYSLTYEKDTPLFAAVKNKSVLPLEDDAVAAMYEAAIDKLSLRGFKQYEVSSFAKEGHRCRHNLSYWENNPYVGLGASAVSYELGVRTKNVAEAADYIRRVREARPVAESSEKLRPERRAKETAAVKIRTKDGIDFAWFRQKTGFDLVELEGKSISALVEQGLIKYKKEGNISTGIALKRKGFLFCDTVSSSLL